MSDFDGLEWAVELVQDALHDQSPERAERVVAALADPLRRSQRVEELVRELNAVNNYLDHSLEAQGEQEKRIEELEAFIRERLAWHDGEHGHHRCNDAWPCRAKDARALLDAEAKP